MQLASVIRCPDKRDVSLRLLTHTVQPNHHWHQCPAVHGPVALTYALTHTSTNSDTDRSASHTESNDGGADVYTHYSAVAHSDHCSNQRTHHGSVRSPVKYRHHYHGPTLLGTVGDGNCRAQCSAHLASARRAFVDAHSKSAGSATNRDAVACSNICFPERAESYPDNCDADRPADCRYWPSPHGRQWGK